MLQRCLPGALVLARRRPAVSARGQPPPAQPQKPRQPADQKPETARRASPEESPVYKEQVVVTASKTEQALVNAPATVSLITGETLQNNALHQLRGSVPGGARAQRHADLRARHQPHEPRRHVDAVDRPARAGRWPQHLPGLLRLRRLGLPAGESRRDQADRSHPRPGLRHLGRQRDERRRQRDHEVAARAAGIERDDRRGRLRPRDVRTGARATARCSTSTARTRRP